MRFLIIALVLCALMTEAHARKPAAQKLVKPVQGISSVKLGALAKGLMAVRGRERYVTPALVSRLEKEAREVVAMPGNGWMKPHILLGLAVTESDLKGNLKAGYGAVADCGLTQINITRFRMSRYKKIRLCRRIRKDTKLSMVWTMKEMNTIKLKYCNAVWLKRIVRYQRYGTWRMLTADQHFWRCVLNTYNQGPRFITYKHNTCTFKRRFREDPSQAYLDKQAKKCRSRNRYWLRTMCFATGIRLNKSPKYARRRWTHKGWKVVGHRRARCRRVWTWKGMRKLFAWKPLVKSSPRPRSRPSKNPVPMVTPRPRPETQPVAQRGNQ